jgi:hypothetical protein
MTYDAIYNSVLEALFVALKMGWGWGKSASKEILV